MVLVDTSIWIGHFRAASLALTRRLSQMEVFCHPAIIGELALGTLHDRHAILPLLAALPQVTVASDADVMHLVQAHQLYGEGIGWVDAHLLCAALLTPCELWSSDKKLTAVATLLGVSHRA